MHSQSFLLKTATILLFTFSSSKNMIINNLHKTLLNNLSHSPETVLKKNNALKDHFYPHLFSFYNTLPLNQYRKNLAIISQKNPIFMLDECDGHCCPLSRSHSPYLRNAYAQAVAQKIVSKINAKKLPINYVSFGSGVLFQDMVIVSQALSSAPTIPLNIHFIDHNYLFYYEALTTILHQTPQFVPTHYPEENPKFQSLLNIMELDNPDYKKGKIVNEFRYHATLLTQFHEAIKNMFPTSNVSLHTYPTVDNYLKYITKNNLEYPDVIAACDIQDPSSRVRKAAEEYIKLCKAALLNNNSSENCGLLSNEYPFLSREQTLNTYPSYSLGSLFLRTENLSTKRQNTSTDQSLSFFSTNIDKYKGYYLMNKNQ